ncbi:hypothetical protein D3C86_1445200 [compost metagenome]
MASSARAPSVKVKPTSPTPSAPAASAKRKSPLMVRVSLTWSISMPYSGRKACGTSSRMVTSRLWPMVVPLSSTSTTAKLSLSAVSLAGWVCISLSSRV